MLSAELAPPSSDIDSPFSTGKLKDNSVYTDGAISKQTDEMVKMEDNSEGGNSGVGNISYKSVTNAEDRNNLNAGKDNQSESNSNPDTSVTNSTGEDLSQAKSENSERNASESSTSTTQIRLPSIRSSHPQLPVGSLFPVHTSTSSSPIRMQTNNSLLALPNPPSPTQQRQSHGESDQPIPPQYPAYQLPYPAPMHPYQHPMHSYPASWYPYQPYAYPQPYAPPDFQQSHLYPPPPPHMLRSSQDSGVQGEFFDREKDQGKFDSVVISAKDVVAEEVIADGRTRKMYPCPTPGCNKSFTRRYNLQSHLMVHTGMKPFVCNHCGTSFSRQHDLRRHVRSLHSEDRPHQCVHCNLSFARSDALKRHLASEAKREGEGGLHAEKSVPAA